MQVGCHIQDTSEIAADLPPRNGPAYVDISVELAAKAAQIEASGLLLHEDRLPEGLAKSSAGALRGSAAACLCGLMGKFSGDGGGHAETKLHNCNFKTVFPVWGGCCHGGDGKWGYVLMCEVDGPWKGWM
jgi:hypothetical protein